MSNVAVILLAGDAEEDVLPMRQFFQKLYSKNPIFVTRGGDEAIAYLSGKGKYANRVEYPMPDLMLMKLKRPPTDAIAVVKWIGQQTGLGAMKVIVLTGSEKLEGVQSARCEDLARMTLN